MEDMKKKARKEYYRWMRKVLESKLNGGNVINAMNTWAVANVDRLYVSRNEGGRGMVSIKNA